VVREGLDRLEVDRYGLEKHDREILRSVIEKYGGGPVGGKPGISVGESWRRWRILRTYCSGRSAKNPRGRVAAPRGNEHLGYRTGKAD
jgi:Holliday junction DNA helicase RuvB